MLLYSRLFTKYATLGVDRLRLIVILFSYSYLIGSIPFGYLIVSAKTGGDVRETGSGGTGATNVSRRAGKAAGVLTLLLDAAKGAVVVIIAKVLLSQMDHSTFWIGMTGIVAILGHIFPVWLAFRGGKGVATGVGVFLVLAPLAVGAAAILFFVTVFLTRYISLGSIIASLSVPLLIWLESLIRPVNDPKALVVTTLIGALLIVYAHRGNIHRLMSGTENKFSR